MGGKKKLGMDREGTNDGLNGEQNTDKNHDDSEPNLCVHVNMVAHLSGDKEPE